MDTKRVEPTTGPRLVGFYGETVTGDEIAETLQGKVINPDSPGG